ncbi:MAG: hypothetical protein ACI8QS_001908 [Planctomycetota bacterium]|jgi:hypothetical protein
MAPGPLALHHAPLASPLGLPSRWLLRMHYLSSDLPAK